MVDVTLTMAVNGKAGRASSRDFRPASRDHPCGVPVRGDPRRVGSRKRNPPRSRAV